jgi:hypothetical protein
MNSNPSKPFQSRQIAENDDIKTKLAHKLLLHMATVVHFSKNKSDTNCFAV